MLCVWQWMCLVIVNLNINVHINWLWMTHNDMIIYTTTCVYIRIEINELDWKNKCTLSFWNRAVLCNLTCGHVCTQIVIYNHVQS